MNVSRTIYKLKPVLFLFILTGHVSYCQDNNTAGIEQSFREYQQQNIAEKVFLHTDRTFYLAGESIWFSVYVLDAFAHQPLGFSKVCYVEILNSSSKPAWQSTIMISEGRGNSAFIIPASFLSGQYKIRAYTSWMKNKPADFFFEQAITIVNTFKPVLFTDTTLQKQLFDLQFFPEGGAMVAGLSSVVAFKLADNTGKGCSCSGVVLNSRKDTVAAFNAFRFGMGHFSFVPQKGESYTATANCNGQMIRANLPMVQSEGYVMHTEPDGDKIKVEVYASNANEDAFLLVHSGKQIDYAAAVYINNGKGVFYINTTALGDGMAHITLFNKEKRPVCERLFFKKPENKMVLQVSNIGQEYGVRKPVRLELTAGDIKNTDQAASVSMGVYNIDDLQEHTPEEINSYLWLQSELKGNIESPEYYFDATNQDAADALDNLLLTQGWRSFAWDEVLKGGKPLFEFIPEYEGPVISGTVTNRKTGTIAANIPFYICVPGARVELRTAVSNSSGIIRFHCNPLYGKNEIIFLPVNSTDSIFRVNMVSPFSNQYTASGFSSFSPKPDLSALLEYRSINTQADNAFLVDKKQRIFTYPEADTSLFYGKPDHQYKLDDYTRFLTMEEVMKEFVLDVRLRKKEDKFYLRVWDGLMKVFFENDPLVLIDGLPVWDADKIMKLDPSKLKSVEIVSRKFYLDKQVNEGIVSIKSYAGDFGGYILDPAAIVLEYDGLQRQRTFYSPMYETAEQAKSRIPDFRHLLFWSPQVIINKGEKKTISFYTSDLKGKFAILVQGISNLGLAGSQWVYFEVK